jgi:ABC-2 type transport system permease protein
VARRVLRQLARDRRFLAFSLVAPIAIIYLVDAFIDALGSPLFDPTPLVVPLGAFIVHFITYVLCAIVLVRERTAQTLARMFVAGYRQGDIIAGYVLAYSTLATAQSLLVLGELTLLFDLKYGWTTLLAIYGVIWLLALVSIALGILISNFARTEGQVFPFIPLIILPSILLSGIILPVASLPAWARWLSYGVPLSYANNVLGALTTPDQPFGATPSLAGLVVCGVVVIALATATLRETD